MNETYANALADHGASLITHIGLVNENGQELAGGAPAYARKALAWTAAASGRVRPSANIVFDIPAGATVAGWRAYTAANGGTDYGGAALTNETFGGQGEYTLLANATGILHTQG